jgi:outer membrane lipoprotein-sorting protein
MKAFKLFILVAAGIFMQTNLSAQTVDEIVSKHIEAIGGADNWKKVNSLVMEAGISTGGMDIPVTISRVNNKAMRQEFTVMSMTGYTIITNEGGWSFNPMQGQSKAEAMSADEIKAAQDGLDLQGDLLDYASKGHTVTLLGKEDIDGTSCYKLKLTRKSGRETVYCIDSKTYYCIQEQSAVSMNGQEIQQVMKLSNFTKLPEGITMPMTMENGMVPAPININKVTVNPTLSESLFKPAQ